MQQVIKGRNSLLQIPALLQQKKVQQVLLVTGRHFEKEAAFFALKREMSCPFQILHAPISLLQINELPALENFDALVAIGGGKVLDFAKGILYQLGKKRFFVAVPTTAGSGSEATPFAVFYSGKEKISFDSPLLLPQVVVLDPALLMHLPPLQKAISGADAFAQCIESVWNLHASAASEAFALEGVALLYHHLPAFITSHDEKLAQQILWAAHLSGKAIAHTRTTGPHALSYYLTAHHGIPHGQAVALFLPLFFLYNDHQSQKDQLQKIYRVLQVNGAAEAMEACRRFFKTLGLATNFTELGLNEIDIDQLLSSVNQQRFANNPATFDAVRLKKLIQRYLL